MTTVERKETTLNELLKFNNCSRCRHPIPPKQSTCLILAVVADILHQHGFVGEKDFKSIHDTQMIMLENGQDTHFRPPSNTHGCQGYRARSPKGSVVIAGGGGPVPEERFLSALEQAEKIIKGWFSC